MSESDVRLHQLWLHDGHKEPFSDGFRHDGCRRLETREANKRKFSFLLLKWKKQFAIAVTVDTQPHVL